MMVSPMMIINASSITTSINAMRRMVKELDLIALYGVYYRAR
jgi:hypothetical protein